MSVIEIIFRNVDSSSLEVGRSAEIDVGIGLTNKLGRKRTAVKEPDSVVAKSRGGEETVISRCSNNLSIAVEESDTLDSGYTSIESSAESEVTKEDMEVDEDDSDSDIESETGTFEQEEDDELPAIPTQFASSGFLKNFRSLLSGCYKNRNYRRIDAFVNDAKKFKIHHFGDIQQIRGQFLTMKQMLMNAVIVRERQTKLSLFPSITC
ncbi:hypothetical protein M3Y95_01063000 [Aphelenchoides besseyi]|nr:hypothetical protein M3Y95_01063000 [Aphelenchoides besseyi]